jgi:hypothetical protein
MFNNAEGVAVVDDDDDDDATDVAGVSETPRAANASFLTFVSLAVDIVLAYRVKEHTAVVLKGESIVNGTKFVVYGIIWQDHALLMCDNNWSSLVTFLTMSFQDIEAGVNHPSRSPSSASNPQDAAFLSLQSSLSLQVFKMNANVQGILKLVDQLGTAKDSASLRKSLCVCVSELVY